MKSKKTFFILIILLTIGFASISATLIITGVIGVSTKKSDFNVKFTNAKLDGVERKDFINADDPKLLDYTIENVTEVGASSILNYDVTNTSRVYDAEVSITCNIVDNDNNPTTSEYISMDYMPKEKLTIRAGQKENGSITTTLIKSSTKAQSINVRCELKAEATERDTLGEEYKEPSALPAGVELIEDKGTIGTLDVGDKIKVGTENFYVISNTDTELNALAEYNLKVGGIYNGFTLENTIQSTEEGYGRQDASMVGHNWQEGKKYGTVPFSETSGWASNATIDVRNEAYRGGSTMTALDALYGVSGYEKYIQETIPYSSVRLITKGEIEALINDGNELQDRTNIEEKANAKGYSWIYSTTYWTESSYGYNSVWGVYSHGSAGNFSFMVDDPYSSSYWYGVRPVITIPKGNTFTVTFDSNGGNAIDKSIEVMNGHTYGKLPIPTKEGYYFLGWYTETGEKINSTSLVKIRKNHTLIAKWSETPYQLVNDVNKNGIADIGDKIKVGTENFYVISNTDAELNALAEYNLKVGGIYNESTLESTILSSEEGYGRQDSKMVGYNWQEGKKYGTLTFSTQNGWPRVNNATIDIRNEAYRAGKLVTSKTMTALDALYGEHGYEKYIQETIPDVSVRLISKEEIEALINDGGILNRGQNIEEKADAKGYSWLYSTTYWTETANGDALWTVYSHGVYGQFGYLSVDDYYNKYCFGVRPVITISLT